MPEWRTIPTAVLDAVVVYIDEVPYTASYAGDKVVVDGAPRKIAPATRSGSEIKTRAGSVGPSFLHEKVEPDDVDAVIAAALVVSAHVGHPRHDGKPPREIWVEHVALVLELDPRDEVWRSGVRGQPGEHAFGLTGRVRYEIRGRSVRAPADAPDEVVEPRARRRPLQGDYRPADDSSRDRDRDPFPFDPNELDRRRANTPNVRTGSHASPRSQDIRRTVRCRRIPILTSPSRGSGAESFSLR